MATDERDLMAIDEHDFLFVLSCHLDINIQVRVLSLTGFLSLPPNRRSPAVKGGCFVVTISVYCNGRLVGFPVSTSYKASKPTKRALQTWNEWITLPVKYSEVSRDAYLHVSLWDVSDGLQPLFVAQSTVSLFNSQHLLRSKIVDLRMECAETPDPTYHPTDSSYRHEHSEIDRLLELTKEYDENIINHVDWLDRITFPTIEEIKQEKKDSRCLYLMIQMANIYYGNERCTYSVVHYDKEEESKVPSGFGPTPTDPELGLENLCETKHHMMTRNARSVLIDRDLKPNASVRDALERIIQMPASHTISSEQRDLIWKFRYYLHVNPKALPKFVKSVNWDELQEAGEALQLIYDWKPVDAEDALELLSPVFLHADVRRYAVSRLAHASKEQILLFLPQLVQALKYESPRGDMSIIDDNEPCDDTMNDSEHSTGGDTNASVAASVSNTSNDLASFLIQSGCQDPVIANYLYWYLTVEIEATASIDSSKLSNEYKRIRARLQKALQMAGGEARQRENSIRMQKKLVETLVSMTKLVSQETGGRTQKEKALRKAIREHSDLKDMPGLCLPVDPLVKVKAIVPEATMVFNSTRMPIKLCFETETNERYTTVFKSGDDLRQDQLVVQMIRIMDRLLRREGLDLRLTPYSVLATSPNDGFIEFVKSTPLTSVMSNWSSIQEFLRSFRPSPNSRYGIEHEVLENYVRSCAGYSIICYILGIGDRHLNNLLLCESGRLFHIDFGFFLGRDPKPLPPPMKLTTEMVNAMGGLDSKEWKDFRGFCFSAFNILRRHANLILNLFSLMLDAGIPDIAIEKDKAVQKVEQRFHLEMTEEMADQHIQMLIDESVNAKMPIIVDLVHNFTQYMRN